MPASFFSGLDLGAISSFFRQSFFVSLSIECSLAGGLLSLIPLGYSCFSKFNSDPFLIGLDQNFGDIVDDRKTDMQLVEAPTRQCLVAYLQADLVEHGKEGLKLVPAALKERLQS